MDPRVRKHAEIIAAWSTRIQPGDDVVVEVGDGTRPLADALAASIAKRGGHAIFVSRSEAASRATYLNADPETLDREPTHLRALYEAADVFIHLRGGANTRALSDVPKEALQRRSQALQGLREVRLSKRWCLTMHPTPALAQEAGLSTEAFADLFYDATLIDWRAFAKEVERVAERFQGSGEVHLVAPDTDLYLPVKDRPWVASIGTTNLPSGEAFTAPHEHRVEGHVHLDLPAVVQGQEVQGVTLQFEKGEVVDFSAERGEQALASLLETDEGASRLGELGIGMNRGIQRPTKNILLDEKMGGTIHLALGRAYKQNNGTNESAIHQDLIKTMGKGSYLAADGEVVQRDGRFWYEGNF